MNEKDLKILEKYDLIIDKIYRGRGSYMCESSGKIYLLKEYPVSEEKAANIGEVMEYLNVKDDSFADVFVKNSDGNYISRDRDNYGFLLKMWCKGQECDVKDIEQITLALSKLAELHNLLRDKDKVEFVYKPLSCAQEFEKRIKELKKIKNYITKKKSKTEFELKYINCFEQYITAAAAALDEAGKMSGNKFYLCHGDFNHHNVLFDNDKVCIVNFDKCHYGSQIEDLYLFLRKILEKYDWDIDLADKMLNAYEGKRKLGEDEKKELYLRFAFPEKFWKISNHYYNSRKVLGIEKNQKKMDRLIEQAQTKQNFLKYLHNTFFG